MILLLPHCLMLTSCLPVTSQVTISPQRTFLLGNYQFCGINCPKPSISIEQCMRKGLYQTILKLKLTFICSLGSKNTCLPPFFSLFCKYVIFLFQGLNICCSLSLEFVFPDYHMTGFTLFRLWPKCHLFREAFPDHPI